LLPLTICLLAKSPYEEAVDNLKSMMPVDAADGNACREGRCKRSDAPCLPGCEWCRATRRLRVGLDVMEHRLPRIKMMTTDHLFFLCGNP
jgi:hypothetical protein